MIFEGSNGWGLQFLERNMSEQLGTFGEILQEALGSGGASGVTSNKTVKEEPTKPQQEQEYLVMPNFPVRRSVLWDAGTISIRVPMGARLNFKQDGLPPERRYLYFSIGVRGGYIPAHVYADGGLGQLVPLAGKTITATCRLMKKTIGSRVVLYIDLKKIDGAPTHTLAVYTKAEEVPKDAPRGFRVRVPDTKGMVHLYRQT